MTIEWLGQSSTTPVVTFKKGHRYRARWSAPVPCQLIPVPVMNAALQALGAQAGQSAPWSTPSFDLNPVALGCQVVTYATWQGPDATIDPEVARLPVVGAPIPLVPEEIYDETDRRVVYDLRSQPRPPPPGPAPVPPPQGGPPPGSGAQPVTAQKSVWPWIAGIAFVGLVGTLLVRR